MRGRRLHAQLLAKAPASKGKVTWNMSDPGPMSAYMADTDEGDMIHAHTSRDGFDSVVVAAYDREGRHSVFAIAESLHLCDLIESMECPDDASWPPGDGQ